MAILASIIGRTRVPLFPWYLLSQTLSTPLNTDDMKNPRSIESLSPNTGAITQTESSKDPSSAEIGSILEIFLTAVPYEAKVEWTRTCFSVIELILWGSKTVDAIFDHLVSTVERHLEAIVKDGNLEQTVKLSVIWDRVRTLEWNLDSFFSPYN